MSSGGSVTLREIAGRLPRLEVPCSRCERRGRLNVAKQIERHGADARLPDLRGNLAGDCPRGGATSPYERTRNWSSPSDRRPQIIARNELSQDHRAGGGVQEDGLLAAPTVHCIIYPIPGAADRSACFLAKFREMGTRSHRDESRLARRRAKIA